MKHIPRILFFLFACLFLSSGAIAQTADPAATESTPAANSIALGDKKAEQQRLRERTQQIIQQLDSIILEYDRNGLAGEQVEDLKRTRLLLSNSSIEEMEKILTKLDQAQQAGSESEARAFLMGAYSGQLAVLVQLRDLVNEYNQKRDVSAVPAILQELVQRQEANYEAGISLAQDVKPGRVLTDIQSASVDSQYEEQRDLSEQFNYIISTIEIIASGGDPESAPLYKGALALIQQKRIVGQLSSAREALDQEQVYSAVSFEKNALTAMQELIAYLTPKPPRSERLLELADKLKKVIQEQTLLQRDIPKKAEKEYEMRSLASYQSIVLQDVVSIHETARNEAPEVVPSLKQAIDKMRAARMLMPSKSLDERQASAEPALQSIAFMEQALALLEKAAEQAAQQEQQLANQQAQPENQQDKLADFAEKLQKLIQWQTALNIQTRRREKTGGDFNSMTAEQERIRTSTEYLQKEAWETTPVPAEILGRAARKMAGASSNMTYKGREALVLAAQDEALELLLLAARQTASEQADQQDKLADENADPAANEEQLAQADDALNKAEQATNDALNELDQGKEKDALDDIGDALDALADADKPADDQAAKDAQAAQDAKDAQAAQDAKDAQAAAEPKPGEDGDKGQEPQDAQAAAEPKPGEEGDKGQEPQDAQAAAEPKPGEEGDKGQEPQDAQAAAEPKPGEEGDKGQEPQDAQAAAEPKPGEEGEAGEMPGAEAQAAAEPKPGEEGEAGEMPGAEAQAAAEPQPGEATGKPAGELPQGAKDAVAAAEAALGEAQDSLEKGDAETAKAKAMEALDALADAKKAIADAKAEAASGDLVAEIEAAQAGGEPEEGEGQEGEGEGGEPMEGKGKGGKAEESSDMAASESGEGEPGEPSDTPSDSNDPKDDGKLSSEGEKTASSGEDILGEGEFTGLPAREREAIRQSLGESYPDEYRSMIEQYRRNLASGAR